MSEDSGSRTKIAVVAIACTGVGLVSAGVLGGYLSPTLTTLGSLVSIVVGARGGYNYIQERDFSVSDPDEVDYGLFAVPAYADLKENQSFAMELLEDHEWREDQNRKRPGWVRRALYQIFHRLDFSNTKMEVGLLSTTSVSLTVFLVIIIDTMQGGPMLPDYLRPIAATYPDTFSIRNTAAPLILSILGIMTGVVYFSWKQGTTCPDGTPFALEYLGSYFQTDDLQEEQRMENNERVPITVAYGYEVYFCHEHSRYYVREEDWVRS